MKIFVRHVSTGLFLATQGKWAAENEAREFETIQQAGLEAWQHQGTNVVLCYDDPKCYLNLSPALCVPDLPISRAAARLPPS